MKLLSILICTLPERSAECQRLIAHLDRINKYPDQVEVVYNSEGRNVPTGTKRNMLMRATSSEYFTFLDDDDGVPDYYIDELVEAVKTKPDVVTFTGWMTTDGQNKQEFTIRLGEKYEERNGRYYRFPNHICCFRREALRGIQFPQIWKQEDYQWAKAIHDRKLLRTEVHIDKPMYYYLYNSKKDMGRRSRVTYTKLR